MEASPVRLTVEWKVAHGQARALTVALHDLMIATRRETGCAGCSLATEVGSGVTLRYHEGWETEEDLRRHVRSDRFSMLAGLLEQATEAPLIDFALPDCHRGIDYVVEARRGPGESEPPPAVALPAPDARGGRTRTGIWRLQGPRR